MLLNKLQEKTFRVVCNCADHVNCLLNVPVLRAFKLFYHVAFRFNKLHERSVWFQSVLLVYFLLRMHFERDNSYKLLKTVIKLVDIETFSSYLAVNTIHLDYKSQQVNVL